MKKTSRISGETIKALKESSERLSIALYASKIGIWELHIKSGAVIWDDNVYTIFGLAKSDFDNTLDSYLDLIYPEDRKPSLKKIQSAIDNSEAFNIEHRVVKGNGEVIWLEGWGMVVNDSKGKPNRLIGAVADITERKKIQISLEQRDLLFSALSNATSSLLTNPNLDEAINEGLHDLGKAMQVDRIYLFENDAADTGNPTTTSQRFEWNSGVANPQINNPDLQHMPLMEFEPCSSILAKGHPFSSHVKDLADSSIKTILTAQQILSVLFFPIIVKNSFWGFIGIDACKEETIWNSVQLSVLQSYASGVSRALENKMVEDEKQAWKTRYELVAAASGQVIYDYDLKSGNIVWGGNVQELLGYTRIEMGDINQWVELIHPHDRTRCLAELEQAEKDLSGYDVIYRFCHKNGNYLHMHDKGFFVADKHNKPYRMLGMMHDITEMKRAEEELVESEARYRTFMSASFSGIGIHDFGVFVEVNQGLADLSGYTVDELIGMQSIQLVAPEYRDLVMENIKSGSEEPYDIEALHKNGSRKYLEIHGKNIPFRNKMMRITEFRDITQRKIAEEKILEQNAKLSSIAKSLTRQNEQLEEFTQIVSHNLRSPVGNLQSLIQFLEQTTDQAERKEIMQLLDHSGKLLLSTLSELNEVLSVQQNADIEKKVLSFESVLEKTKQMIISRINETGAVVNYDFSKAPEITYPNIYLESILLNLLSNALKYRHPDRKPVVCFKTYYDGQQLILEVSDNGLGINLSLYGHQLFKLRKTFHDHVESRGVGLFLIKNQIESMGGEIKIQSEENVGSTFIVTFNKLDT